MPSDPLSEVQEFLRALASETRQKILFLFATGQELSVGQVAQAIQISQSTTSEHLSMLRRAGLLQVRREGKEVYYRPNRARMLELAQQLTHYLASCCPPEP
jgi:ArsR family transcriptional regulator, arsenate/arsenite/antimonite-responsive transcriptional repressor